MSEGWTTAKVGRGELRLNSLTPVAEHFGDSAIVRQVRAST